MPCAPCVPITALAHTPNKPDTGPYGVLYGVQVRYVSGDEEEKNASDEIEWEPRVALRKTTADENMCFRYNLIVR